MAYTGDKSGAYCSTCKKKVRLIRCEACKGKGGGWTTQCSACGNSGYNCENGRGNRYHRV